MSTDEGRGGSGEATVDLSSGAEIRIARVIAAPVALVFSVWTDVAHLEQWWGPDGFRTTTHQADIRPGGSWLFTMHGPDGTDYPNRVIFEEIVSGERIVYAHDGGEGELTSAVFRSTITFRSVVGGTEVAMLSVFPSEALRDQVIREYGAVEGGKQHLGRLAVHVAALL